MDKDVGNYTAKQYAKAVRNPIAGVSDGLLFIGCVWNQPRTRSIFAPTPPSFFSMYS